MDKELALKRDKLIKNLLQSVGSDIKNVTTEEQAQKVAQNWADVADLDKNGTVQFAEFKEFFKDDEFDEPTLRAIFQSMDADANQDLDVQEIGKVIL